MPSTARAWPGWSRGSVSRYLVAILAVAIAILARYLLQPVLGDRYPFVTLYVAVLVVSSTFGFGPGLVTSIAGAAVASLLFVPAPGAILEGGREAYGQVIRLAMAVAVAGLGASVRRGRQRVELIRSLRREMARELRAREERYRTLFDYAPDGILIANSGSYYSDANASMCRMLGYSREELIGRQAADIVTGTDPMKLAAALDAIREHSEFRQEWRFRRKDGSTFQADVIATRMPDGNLLAMVRDVTEQRNLEAQYQQAQKMDAIGRLAGGVAHDFNNLLTVILGNCELLHDDLPRGGQEWNDVHEIQLAAERAGALTRQLLAFSRKQVVALTPLDLNSVVSDMRSMIERLIGENISVRLGLATPLATIKADRSQLEQILLNLSVNARDAMPNGGQLTIETANVEVDEHHPRTHLTATPGPYVALTVSDTGVGMSKEVLSHLFEPFFTTKEIGSGTGLGLATIHGIVKQGGGFIHVYSEVGHGTSFRVYLPQREAGEPRPDTTSVLDPDLMGSETVLVVEDSESLRALARRLLERLGYKVLTAADADAAMALVNPNTSIDVLLTDVVMPGASGPELTTELLKRKPYVKVIFMSGYTQDAIAHSGVVKPGVDFLHKPFTSETLGRKVRQVLGRR